MDQNDKKKIIDEYEHKVSRSIIALIFVVIAYWLSKQGLTNKEYVTWFFYDIFISVLAGALVLVAINGFVFLLDKFEVFPIVKPAEYGKSRWLLTLKSIAIIIITFVIVLFVGGAEA